MSCCQHRFLGLVLPVLAIFSVGAQAGQPAVLDAPALAARIDQHISGRWQARHVQPAPPADDATFIRRVYLDLTGCIPSIVDARDFLDDTRPDKRRIWVDELLQGQRPADKPDAYASHFANVWRAWLVTKTELQDQGVAGGFEAWLKQLFKENAGHDRMVRELISSDAYGSSGAGLFFSANEYKPENLASSTSRLFLGIKLECAQCHEDRSGGNWTRTQFWEFAAFFAGVQRREGQAPDSREIQIPGKDKRVQARFLDGSAPAWKAGVSPRRVLADWLTAPDNRYFARAAVNRLWAYLLGTGLVEPMDEHGAHNPASHPELLDELATQFALHRYDWKYLLRAIAASRVYQLSSETASAAHDDPRTFSRMAVRGLSAEQLFDSVAEATEHKEPVATSMRANSPRAEFLARFTASHDKRTEPQTSILQALFLMNSSFMADRNNMEQNQTLRTIAEAAKLSTARRVESLYLVVLSRKPRAAELERMVKYVDSTGTDPRKALTDIYWALLNSAEFRLNH